MQVAEYIVKELEKYHVTDAFGIPGGVLLQLIYAMDGNNSLLVPHLSYHEQMAGFAACGYAQASGHLAVAYATRGPGITNMITCMAEAYQESLPVLFITAHGNRTKGITRFANNQELDLVNSVSGFTKYAANVDSLNALTQTLREACESAINGRKGPVFLDFSASLLKEEIPQEKTCETCMLPAGNDVYDNTETVLASICTELKKSKHPLILIGDGLRHCEVERKELKDLVKSLGIPVVSSRAAQDIISDSPYYFGYIGSHGTRYSNFILSKADLIIAVGNRMAFPVHSKSFAPIVQHARVIRLDIDRREFERKIPTALNFWVDIRQLLKELLRRKFKMKVDNSWLDICRTLKANLKECDVSQPVQLFSSFLAGQKEENIYVCDVGNNEFWFARAFEKEHPTGSILYSKAFGTLGVALGRAIGAYYGTRKKIICILGDQGFQYNIQELQYIKQWNLPITIVVLNNRCSSMIADHEKKLFGTKLVHVTNKTGYDAPCFEKIAEGYGIRYTAKETEALKKYEGPVLYEIKCNENVELSPMLPQGNACQNMEPLLEKAMYDYLDNL